MSSRQPTPPAADAERERVEAALRLCETRLRRLYESGIIGIGFSDRAGKLFECNDALLRMLGYSREELESGALHWRALTPREHAGADRRAGEQLEASGVAQPFEKELIKKDGARVPVLIGMATLDGPSVIAYAADLTERKRAEESLHKSEEQLRQSQKMEAIGQLTGGIAHDFNNLLAVILSSSTLVLGELGAEDPRREDLEEIKLAAERAASLTRQLLAFSRKQVLEPRPLDLNEVVSGLEGMLRRVLGADIELRTALAPGLGTVRADVGQIEQVIMNLAVNARDAMAAGGRLRIETSNAELEPGRPCVLLAVSDTGVGMDAATRQRIFEPFFTTKESGKGTGLGLSTCWTIVKESGGQIAVQSEPGRGSVFKVYLPRIDGATKVGGLPRKSSPQLSGDERVLLVEDDDHVRAAAKRILEAHGYRVLATGRGQEALGFVDRLQGRIDLVVSDVVMPELSGPELLEHVRKLHPGIKVLLMTGYADPPDAGPCASGAAIIHKPFTAEALALRVREILGAIGTISG